MPTRGGHATNSAFSGCGASTRRRSSRSCARFAPMQPKSRPSPQCSPPPRQPIGPRSVTMASSTTVRLIAIAGTCCSRRTPPAQRSLPQQPRFSRRPNRCIERRARARRKFHRVSRRAPCELTVPTTLTKPMTTEASTVAASKPKKSVALSGVVAGNTALCTVGRTGNDLHYRGYNILDIADSCEFEEIAYLLVHGKLPTMAELRDYKTKLRGFRGIPESVRKTLELIPASAHPMDVMRTAVSALGAVLPEADSHEAAGARGIADRLMASLGSMLLYWHHWTRSGRRIDLETDDD